MCSWEQDMVIGATTEVITLLGVYTIPMKLGHCVKCK